MIGWPLLTDTRSTGLTPGEASRRLFTRAQVAAMISCGRMLLGRLTGDTATFRKISAKHWHRPALVFNGREEDTFEIQLAQLSARTAGRIQVTGGLSFSALPRAGSPVRLWQPQGRSGTMNTLADCAIARHGGGR
jgi:hypothetical protein